MQTSFPQHPSAPAHLPPPRFVLTLAFALAAAGLARAQFTPLQLAPGSYNQDMVIEQSAPQGPAAPTTATMDGGTDNTGYTWYEIGFNQPDPTTGVPLHGSTFTSVSLSDHSYRMAPSYYANDALLVDSSSTFGTLTVTNPAAYTKLSFLVSSGNGATTLAYTVHYADSSTDSGTFSISDWFDGANPAVIANGRYQQSPPTFGNVNSGDPRMYSADVTLTHTATAVTSIDFSYSSGTGHGAVFAVSGSTGAAFTPIGVTGYNQDMIIEAKGVLNGAYTTASMDAGTANTANSWYEQGYNPSDPSTGFPPAGSTFTHATYPDHQYTMASSYAANNAAFIDASHSATLTLATPGTYEALSFLTAAGNGPVGIDYTIHYADGSSELGNLSALDWFNFSGNVVAFTANGRADVQSGAFDSVDSGNPNLYSVDVAVGNPGVAVVSIDLAYDPGNSGGRAGVFALSGLAAFTSPTPPYNVAVSPITETQYVGGTATFSVTASGTAPLTYQWFKGTSLLSGKTAPLLSLPGLASGGAGSYSCVVSNATGLTATSGVALLSVLALPSGSSGSVLADGPLAYYRLNEPGPLVAQVATNSGSLGASGNGTHFPSLTHQVSGAIVGDPDTAAGYSAIDPASDDGCVSTIIPYTPALNPTGSFTVEAWLRPTAEGNLGNAQAPLNNQFNDASGNRVGWDFFQRAAANQTPDSHGPGYSFRMFNGTSGNESQTTVFNITGGAYQVGQWSHLVAVYDATALSATLYLNGQQVAQAFGGNGTFVANTNSPLSIGGYPDSSQNPFIGGIDEVAIFINALTADQVMAHYQNGTNSARSQSYSSLITGDGAVEYLRLDEPAKNVAQNYGSLGGLANGTYANSQPGLPGPQAPAFPGFETTNLAAFFNSSNSYVELENPPGLNFTGQLTLEAWIQPAPVQGGESYILAHGGNDTYTEETVLRIESGAYQIGSINGRAAYPVPAADLAGTNWVHLAGTYDGTHWNLYRNGALVASAADNVGPYLVNNANWAIGARGRWKRETGLVDPGQDTRIFNGRIDEAAIYNTALSSARIQAHYLVGQYGTTNVSPTVLAEPTPASAYVGGSASFSVTAAGPGLGYQWDKNGAPVASASSSVLSLSDVQGGDAGNYSVTITNSFGRTNSISVPLVVLVPFDYGSVVLGDGPAGFWPLNETSGTVAVDRTGNDNGNYVGSPTLGVPGATPNTGSAVTFNGSSQYVDLGNPSVLNFTGQITLEAWINPQANDGDRYIFGRGYTFSPAWGEEVLRIESGSYQVGVWNGNNYNASYAMPSGDLNHWVYLAGTYDGTQWNLYRNGVLVASGGAGLGPFDIGVGWAIGDGTANGNGRYFQGTIDEAALYGYALPVNRIAAHYSAGLYTLHPLSITVTNGQATLTWPPPGTLQQADAAAGPYTDVATGGTYTVPANLVQKFYRVRF